MGNKKVGSIADYDPMNDQYGSISQQKRNHHQQQQSMQNTGGYRQEVPPSYQSQRSNMYPDSHHQQQAPQPKISAPPTHLGVCIESLFILFYLTD